MEFVSVLYFEKKHEAKKLRHEMMTLQRSFYAFTVVDQSLFEAEGVCVAFNKVSPEHICHVGEVSLLPYLSEPATVFVSSDMEALKAFKLAERLNPSYSPPATAKPGEDIPDG